MKLRRILVTLLAAALLLGMMPAALADAYAAAERIHFDGAYMRHDIGARALAVLEG